MKLIKNLRTKNVKHFMIHLALYIFVLCSFVISPKTFGWMQNQIVMGAILEDEENGIMPVAYTGYHTESHGSHGYQYYTLSGNDGWCAACQAYTAKYVQHVYDFYCGSTCIRSYIYGDIAYCNNWCGTANIADISAWDTNGLMFGYSGANTVYTLQYFHANVLPATVSCPGYLVPDKHTVYFNSNGGIGAPNAFTKTYGTNPQISTAKPTRTGYTFLKWTSGLDGSGLSIAPGGTYTHNQNGGSVTLYAQWTRNTYSVTYHGNGGTTTASTGSYYYEDTVDLSPIANKDGYIFIGWSTDPNAKKPLNSFTMPDLATSTNTNYSSDWELTLYAIYSIPVSDVANHTYPAYEPIKAEEVYMVAWKQGHLDDFRTYPLIYTKNANIMDYEYKLDSTEFFAFVGTNPYSYQIIAFDNAGNHRILYEESSDGTPVPTFPVPQKYLQTIKHFKKNIITGEWIWFDTTTELVLEGETFSPAGITPPAGFAFSSIDSSSYVVTSSITSNAYYEPIQYTLYFDANEGTCNLPSKLITFEDYYGELPTPERTGYSFIGWYTAPVDGNRITSSSRYMETKDRTLYAHWEINSYTITYDYWTNGGTSVSLEQDSLNYGTTIDLSTITAQKSGENLINWKFVGWNTDPNATEGLTEFIIPAKNETLYAIYKKDINVTLITRNNTDTITKILSSTIYNNKVDADFVIMQENTWDGWKLLGWTTETEAAVPPIIGNESIYTFNDSITLYALYSSDITLSYDTNGSAQFIPSQTKERFYNASGCYKNPTFVTAKAPTLDNHTFVQWETLNEEGSVITHYLANETISLESNLHLIAKWDQYPEIEAYDRYFTLKQAHNGEITEELLLEKVIATDKEDGLLANGTDVIIPNMNQYDFTNTTDFIITYQATDKFGNTSEKSIHVYIVDTTTTQSAFSSYIRFINSDFIYNDYLSVSEQYGGLESTSIWRTNSSYKALLDSALEKMEPQKIYTFSSKNK